MEIIQMITNNIPVFIGAGEALININELVYITKAKTKQIYIAVFKNHSTTIGMKLEEKGEETLYLTPSMHKNFLENLQAYYANTNQQNQKENNPDNS